MGIINQLILRVISHFKKHRFNTGRAIACTALLLAHPLALAEPISVGNVDGLSLERVYLELEAASGDTRRRSVSTVDAPVDTRVFTRLKRLKSNGREAYSNATLIAANHCYWIASTAGHSVLDHRYSRLANRGDLALELPDGSWANPVEIIASPRLDWNSDEIDDWALLVLRAPHCTFNDGPFDDGNTSSAVLPHLPTKALDVETLSACRNNVQFLCYHFDQNEAQGQRMLEENCSLLSLKRETGRTAYASCKVDYGVSGCSPVCVQGNLWINLGIFSKGLKRHGSASYPQPVAGFRVMDGELVETLNRLKGKYQIP